MDVRGSIREVAMVATVIAIGKRPEKNDEEGTEKNDEEGAKPRVKMLIAAVVSAVQQQITRLH